MAEVAQFWLHSFMLVLALTLMGHNAWERNRQGFAGWLCCALWVFNSYGVRHG